MNRANLVALVLEGLDRQDLGTSQQPGLWVLQSEQRINKDMRAREMMRRQQRPLFGGSVALPSDFLEMTSVRILPAGTSLDYVSHFAYDDLVSGPQPLSRAPKNYTMIGQDLLVWPAQAAPSQMVGSILEIGYFARLPPLIKDTDTNWLLETNFDVYYAAMMAFGYRFLQEIDKAADYEATVTASIGVLNATAENTVIKGSRLVVRTKNPIGRTR